MRRSFNRIYFNLSSKHRNTYKSIRSITGFTPRNIICYIQALRHHSASNTVHENGSRDSNERLEYLGDAVLSTVIAEMLFKRYPFKNEGFLTEMRSKIVSRESLNELAIKIGLNEIVQYDRKALGMQMKNSIFGNALEAFIGAVYLDAGFDTSKKFIITKLLSHIDIDKLQVTETNYKGKLMEWSQRNTKTVEFEAQEEQDKKNKIYKIRVIISGVVMGEAEHLSKKKAEQMAAQKAYEQLNETTVSTL